MELNCQFRPEFQYTTDFNFLRLSDDQIDLSHERIKLGSEGLNLLQLKLCLSSIKMTIQYM